MPGVCVVEARLKRSPHNPQGPDGENLRAFLLSAPRHKKAKKIDDNNKSCIIA